MASKAITRGDVSRASAELAAMRRSLVSWLAFRKKNDGILAGTVQTKLAPQQARAMIKATRQSGIEQDLADKLHALLAEVMPDAALPNADLRSNPDGAVQLAEIAITGQVPVMADSPAAMEGLQPPWLWPVLIVGGLLLAITTAIRTAADVAKDAEEKDCIKAGACTDYGFWLKAAAVLGIGWFAWKELGVGESVRGFIKKRRS
jgi:hypothetical protein